MRSTSNHFLLLSMSFVILFGVAMPAMGATNGTTIVTTNPNSVTTSTTSVTTGTASVTEAAGSYGHGSKLGAHDAIIITAPVNMSLPGSTSDSTCFSINNNSDTTYFVPWNSPLEWESFLIAIGAPAQLARLYNTPQPSVPNGWISNVLINSCCAPTTEVLCTDSHGNPITTPQLGSRENGDPVSGNAPYYGAQNDIAGPFYASNINGDSTLTYRATYICSSGNWVRTHAEGSCVPVSGQCALGSSQLTALPADLTTLCAPGSVFGGITDGGGSGPWSWTCLGTTGMTDATCHSDYANGACGPAANQPTWNFPSSDSLCLYGETAGNGYGPDWNYFSDGEVDVPNLYHWTCNGLGTTGASTNCSAPYAGGYCGNVNGSYIASAPSPSTTQMCIFGVPTAVTYAQDGNGLGSWNWSCNGPQGNAGCGAYDSTTPQNGGCGSANGSFSTVAPSGGLCDAQSTLASGPTLITGDPPTYSWTCQGNNGGTTATCGSTVDTQQPACTPGTQPWWTSTYWSLTPPDGSQFPLCQNGTPGQLQSYYNWWIWKCSDTVGAQTDWCGAQTAYNGACGWQSGAVAQRSIGSGACNSGTQQNQAINVGGQWTWECSGVGPNTTSISCSAPVDDSQPPPVNNCGAANNGSSSVPPTVNLCATGFVSNVIDDGNGNWVWTCQSDGAISNCSAVNTDSGPGVCGSYNGKALPDAPNINLCSSGGPGAVLGGSNGPWTWECVGDGAYIGQNQSCGATYCQPCSGTVTSNVSIAPQSGVMQSNGCTVNARMAWTETDTLSVNGADAHLSWADPFNGLFQHVLQYGPSPDGYCQACYESVTGVSNATVTVQATAGSCPADAQINSGNPVAYSATGVTLQ